jgi:uncharacterized protein YndB with AHSA1/START domain
LKPGLWVDGATLRTKTGAKVVVRGIEAMYGPTSASNPAGIHAVVTALGANTYSPLPQQNQSTAATLKALLEESRKAGLVLGLNGDHMGNGRARLCAPEVVALVNQYDHVFLECEVETGWGQTPAQWVAGVNEMVAAFRAAGYKCPIKVGSPDGGRSPRLPLAFGAEVVEADPEHSIIFTWQAYWASDSNAGWTYQEHNGFAKGLPGIKACCEAIASSGLCFVVGLDKVDDVGDTGSDVLMQELERLGIGWQWWVLFNGGDPNGMLSNALNAASLTATGQTVSGGPFGLQATARDADLGPR